MKVVAYKGCESAATVGCACTGECWEQIEAVPVEEYDRLRDALRQIAERPYEGGTTPGYKALEALGTLKALRDA